MSQSHEVFVVAALEAYTDLIIDLSVYLHDDPVYPFKHVFMSQVVDKNRGLHRGKYFPIGRDACSRWV